MYVVFMYVCLSACEDQRLMMLGTFLNLSKHFYTISDFVPSDDFDVGNLFRMLTSGLSSCSESH